MVVFPIAELAGGHIFEVGGYGTVYVTSLFVCTCGLLYVIIVVPDETTKCKTPDNDLKSKTSCKKSDSGLENISKTETKANFPENKGKIDLLTKMKFMFQKGNKTIIDSYRYLRFSSTFSSRCIIFSTFIVLA